MRRINPIPSNCCIICQGKKIHYDFSIGKFRVEECITCGMMRLNQPQSEGKLSEICDANSGLVANDISNEPTQILSLKTKTAEYYLSLIESYVDAPLSGKLLEISCNYNDNFLDNPVTTTAWRGVECISLIVKNSLNKPKDKGTLIVDAFNKLLNQRKQLDYIVFVDVLEQARDPREVLKHTHLLLKQDGIVMSIVSRLNSFSVRRMKNNWMDLNPQYLWYFSEQTLRRLFYSERFGNIHFSRTKKKFNTDCIVSHMYRNPVPYLTRSLQIFLTLLPNAVRQYPLEVNTDEIVMFGTKQPIKSTNKISIVMAVFNEEKTLQHIIEKILAKRIEHVELELIIIESSSTDNSREILRKYKDHPQIKIIWQDRPYGKGNAIREGLEYVTGDFILIQDADDEYDIEDYEALIEPLLTGEAAFVLGARHGGRTWKIRKFSNNRLAGHLLNLGHWFFTMLINLLFKMRLNDPFTMYKVFRKDCLHGLKLECNRFDFDFELVIKLAKKGFKPIEIPVNYRSRSFSEGKKINIFKDPLTWFRILIKLKLQKE